MCYVKLSILIVVKFNVAWSGSFRPKSSLALSRYLGINIANILRLCLKEGSRFDLRNVLRNYAVLIEVISDVAQKAMREIFDFGRFVTHSSELCAKSVRLSRIAFCYTSTYVLTVRTEKLHSDLHITTELPRVSMWLAASRFWGSDDDDRYNCLLSCLLSDKDGVFLLYWFTSGVIKLWRTLVGKSHSTLR